MAAGPQAAYDQIVTLMGTTITGLTTSQGTSTFTEAPHRLDMEDAEDAGCHRKFRVIYDSADPFVTNEGTTAGTLTDSYLDLIVQVSYWEGGGNALSDADRKGIDRIAMDDLERARQVLGHQGATGVDNWAQSTTGIVFVQWRGTKRRNPVAGSHKRIYEMAFRLWIRDTVVSA